MDKGHHQNNCKPVKQKKLLHQISFKSLSTEPYQLQDMVSWTNEHRKCSWASLSNHLSLLKEQQATTFALQTLRLSPVPRLTVL